MTSLHRVIQTSRIRRIFRLLLPALCAAMVLVLIQKRFSVVDILKIDEPWSNGQGVGQPLPVEVAVESREQVMLQRKPEEPLSKDLNRLPELDSINVKAKPGAEPAKEDLEMAARQSTLSKGCSLDIGTLDTEKAGPGHGYHVQSRDFYACVVAKIASTFWWRFLYQLVHTDPMESPFDVNVPKAYDVMSELHAKSNVDVASYGIRMVFVREPYSRLFSAFIDKLMSPNPTYWEIWGKEAVDKYRPDSPDKNDSCGQDVSFSEYIRLTVDSEYKKNFHVKPVFTICHPCQVNFTVIGKMESFTDDVKYVVSRLGIPEESMHFERMEADKEEDALNDSTGDSFSQEWLNKTLKCISRETVAKRVWRKLQIRGFVSWRQNLRLTEEQKMSISREEIRKFLKDARAKSTNRTELKIQKKQAFMEAFRTLDESTKQQIKTVYGPDFQLFGYDLDYLEKLEEKHPNFKDTHALDTSKDWDLSPVL